MTEPAPPPPEPSFPRIRRIDEIWCKVERLVAAGMFLFMGLLVFLQVVTKVFGRRHEWIDVVVLFVVVFLAVLTRTVKEGERRMRPEIMAGIAVAITVAIAALVRLYTWWVPTGMIWAQKMAMVLLIWVAMFGASIATYDRSHLALEMGEKLWPEKALRWIKTAAHAVTTAFCIGFFVVAVEIVSQHYARGTKVAEAVTAADPIPIIENLPMWIGFLIVPYAFVSMSVRYLAQTVTTATQTAAPVEERLPS